MVMYRQDIYLPSSIKKDTMFRAKALFFFAIKHDGGNMMIFHSQSQSVFCEIDLPSISMLKHQSISATASVQLNGFVL